MKCEECKYIISMDGVSICKLKECAIPGRISLMDIPCDYVDDEGNPNKKGKQLIMEKNL